MPAYPSIVSNLKAQKDGGGGGGRELEEEEGPVEAGGDEEVLSSSGVASCLLLLHCPLFCGTLLAGALALVLALSIPRCLFEHKPTVSSPQEEVDKAEELQKKSGAFVRTVKEEPQEKWE